MGPAYIIGFGLGTPSFNHPQTIQPIIISIRIYKWKLNGTPKKVWCLTTPANIIGWGWGTPSF